MKNLLLEIKELAQKGMEKAVISHDEENKNMEEDFEQDEDFDGIFDETSLFDDFDEE